MRKASMWCAAMATCVCVVVLADAAAGQRDPKDGWMPLFNGRDLSGWKVRDPDKPNGWIVRDGVYVNTPPSTDILTERSFADFDLYVEVKPEERTNSGLYLRDIYEVQILNSHGKPQSDNMCGALYKRVAPAVNACKPAGEWQTFEVSLVGRRLTGARTRQPSPIRLDRHDHKGDGHLRSSR